MKLNLISNWLRVIAVMLGISASSFVTMGETLRPPAVPLITFDPFLSIWSEADHLTDANTRHWTHREHPLASLIRIDDKAFRLMGTAPGEVPPLPQVSLQTTRRAASINSMAPAFMSH